MNSRTIDGSGVVSSPAIRCLGTGADSDGLSVMVNRVPAPGSLLTERFPHLQKAAS